MGLGSPGDTVQGQNLLAGTLAGHALVAWVAVGAGEWIGGCIREQVLARLSGGLFIAFGLLALHQAIA